MTKQQRFTMWRKASHSGGGDNCIEVAIVTNGPIGVRDSKDQRGPILVFSPRQWTAFTSAVRDGGICP
jgi:hypothetical protein